MDLQHSLLIEELTLRNFRCFEECTLGFHDRLTVLVADNGDGKTAFLDGVALALAPFVETLANRRSFSRFDQSDISVVWNDDDGSMRPSVPTSLSAKGIVSQEQLEWGRNRNGYETTFPTNNRDSRTLIDRAAELSDSVRSNTADSEGESALPLVVFYGTDRTTMRQLKDQSTRVPGPRPAGRPAGYWNYLRPLSYFQGFIDWYREQMRLLGGTSAGLSKKHRPQMLVAAVNEAVRIVLQPAGWQKLDWVHDTLVAVNSRGGHLPVSYTSDGVRNMLTLVADMAHRCAVLNPHFGEDAAAKTPGIALIDEVDLHLHPRWQQLVIDLLRTAFPMLQFVITSHSPQVLSTVPMESIRIIKDGVVHAASPGTEGAEAQRILEDVFQVPSRPDTPTARLLDEYLRLVDVREWETARALELRQELDRWSQGQEPKLLEADLHIENLKWESGQ